MEVPQKRFEVMQVIEKDMDAILDEYLIPIEENWQPSDIIPDPRGKDFVEQVEGLRDVSQRLSTDLLVVLVGDTITEEALPTYESWLMDVVGVDQLTPNGWSRWVRRWTAEENRHGDLLHKYLYLSGRIDMKEVEISTQHLISDGFDLGIGADPYLNFLYTSFQEMATNISHRRVAALAQKSDDRLLANICGTIAADEMRHAKAYMSFVKRFIEMDPSELMLAFLKIIKRQIAMPAHYLRESGEKRGELFAPFSNAAQRLGVYTAADYVDILEMLLREWDISRVGGLTDEAEKARDTLMAFPGRMRRVAKRLRVSDEVYPFKWIAKVGAPA
ncbi:MAG: acyl-ACP desaturase [Elusimicrobia bacterium]|nr:MAG: acyl-ACP desaturase [Elusimicrobiota bacterium]